MLSHRIKLLLFVGALVAFADFFSCNEQDSDSDQAIHHVSYCAPFPESGCFEPAPLPGDPRYGLAGQVLIEDACTSMFSEDHKLDCLWIGLDDPVVWDKILASNATGVGPVIVIAGEILADPSQSHGFYLVPSTISSYLRGIYDDNLTSIDQVESDPGYYEPGGEGGKPKWGLPLFIRAIVSNP